MAEISDKCLLSGDKFMPKILLRQPGFTYSVCGAFTKIKKDYKNQKNNVLDKACFQHDMAYGDFKDLPRITASDKILT